MSTNLTHGGVKPALSFAGRALLGAALFSAGAFTMPRLAGAVIGTGERDVFRPLAPARIMDTRDGTGAVPIAKLGPGVVLEFSVRGQGGVSASATAAVLNVTVTGGSAASHLTLFPGGTVAPNASSMNFSAGQTIANAVTVKIGGNGKVAVRNNSGTVDVLVDVNGFYDDHHHDDRYNTKTEIDGRFAASDYVGAAQIATGAVGASEIADGTVGAAEIATGGVGAAEIADGTVGAAEIADGTVGAAEIATGGVGAAEIADGTVGAAEIADGTVGAAEIADGTVGAAEIATGGVGTSEVSDSSLLWADMDRTIFIINGSFTKTIAGSSCGRIGGINVNSADLGKPYAVRHTSGTINGNLVFLGGTASNSGAGVTQLHAVLCNIGGSDVQVSGALTIEFTMYG